MELYESRGTIRQQLLVLCNENPLTATSGAILDQRNAQIDAASLKTAQDCRFAFPTGRTTVDLGIQQNVLNYPTGLSAGDIIDMAVYDSTGASGSVSGYIAIEKRSAPPEADQDQEQAAGGATFSNVCGLPQFWWNESGQIHLWPFSDIAYKVRIRYAKVLTFANDSVVSIVDAQMIIYYAAFLVRQAKHDSEGAQHWLTLYTDRMRAIKAWQSTGQKIALVSDASFDESEEAWMSDLPRWSTAPTVRP